MSSNSQEHPQRLYRRNRLSVIASQITKRVIHNPYRDHPHIKGLRYVIFPNNVYLQWWDFLMILAVIYYSFSLPWQLGIGGGCEFFVVMLLFVFKSFVSFWKQIISHFGAIILIYIQRTMHGWCHDEQLSSGSFHTA
jgi:hypothetical protein